MGGNFNIRFHEFIQSVYVRFCAKQNLIHLNNGEVIEFLVWPSSDFRAFKNACTEITPLSKNDKYQ